jgi:hypothetical protein
MRAKYMPGFRDCNCDVLWKRIISLVRLRPVLKQAKRSAAEATNAIDL